ncbi:phage tail assembly chaperone [Rufibacter sediminis]|uniref:Uncharacterized protein n=1 Tax=Rufibacter sediminis TaxID=2762756 RepID=A0ABR6VUR6_9BACT|nr:hypothetical protein [Rufibacter sediminis]MBC3540660.1 hypothetical protein [Rufibacter sediminis]
MLETKEKTIDGHEYQVTQFPALKGMRLAVKIGKLLGDGIGHAATTGSVMDMDVSKVVAGIVENLDEEATPNLLLQLFSSTHRDRKEMNESGFNMAYAGNYMEMGKALLFILEVNYGGFMGALEQARSIGSQAEASAAK